MTYGLYYTILDLKRQETPAKVTIELYILLIYNVETVVNNHIYIDKENKVETSGN